MEKRAEIVVEAQESVEEADESEEDDETVGENAEIASETAEEETDANISVDAKMEITEAKVENTNAEVENTDAKVGNTDAKVENTDTELENNALKNANDISEISEVRENISEATDISEAKENVSETKEGIGEVNQSSYDPKNVHYEGDVAIYTDPASGYQYTWHKEKEEWEAKTNMTYGFEDDTHTYTDADGVTYFWDKDKSAWFPKINDDFMAHYQMNYGFIDNTQPKKVEEISEETKEKLAKLQEKAAKKGEKRKASEPAWFELDETQNTKVYVSNLPLDIKEEEFVDIMQKCGIIMRDVNSQKLKIKLYTDRGTNYLKGDALCTYVRVESVDLATKLLDGMELRGKTISVERAKFDLKGEYDPKLKPKSKKRKEKQKAQKMQSQLFDWRPEKMRGERSKHEKIVIVKNVFRSSDFDADVGLILEYQQDLREECSKCGEVRKVIIYDRHPEGVAQVNMKVPEEADACVLLLNGRWFGKRQLTAEIWDGKTKFKIAETDSQISQRLDNWDKFLEDDEGIKGKAKMIGKTVVEEKETDSKVFQKNIIEDADIEEETIPSKVVEEKIISAKVIEEKIISAKVIEEKVVEEKVMEVKVVHDAKLDDVDENDDEVNDDVDAEELSS